MKITIDEAAWELLQQEEGDDYDDITDRILQFDCCAQVIGEGRETVFLFDHDVGDACASCERDKKIFQSPPTRQAGLRPPPQPEARSAERKALREEVEWYDFAMHRASCDFAEGSTGEATTAWRMAKAKKDAAIEKLNELN